VCHASELFFDPGSISIPTPHQKQLISYVGPPIWLLKPAQASEKRGRGTQHHPIDQHKTGNSAVETPTKINCGPTRMRGRHRNHLLDVRSLDDSQRVLSQF
jgi:hypothetical protein